MMLIALGLDADHISAIDNATRQLVSLGQLPITCGIFHPSWSPGLLGTDIGRFMVFLGSFNHSHRCQRRYRDQVRAS